MLPLFGNIYNLNTAPNSGSKIMSIFWQQNVLHVLIFFFEILFLRENIFGWAAPPTSELRRARAAPWPQFRRSVLAGFAPPFSGRRRALPALLIHKMLHRCVQRHMHVHPHAHGQPTYLLGHAPDAFAPLSLQADTHMVACMRSRLHGHTSDGLQFGQTVCVKVRLLCVCVHVRSYMCPCA